MQSIAVDNRISGERRQARRFVVWERRTGFDRRADAEGGLRTLSERPEVLLVLLAAVNVMNVLDQLATQRALAAGFTEGNPVMASLIAYDPRVAFLFKILAVLGVSVGVWSLRRYRLILQVGVLMFGVFAGVLLVHFYGSAFCY